MIYLYLSQDHPSLVDSQDFAHQALIFFGRAGCLFTSHFELPIFVRRGATTWTKFLKLGVDEETRRDVTKNSLATEDWYKTHGGKEVRKDNLGPGRCLIFDHV